MKIYLVGGALRDKLMGRTPKDFDFVVVGAIQKQLLDLGFQKVGASFPVFIDPKTGFEYALARKEIKSGVGHKGFEFIFDQKVSLEEDLFRRDFTINAMALDQKTNEVVDPFDGKTDILNKVLRHVSKHFIEDPLRVIRGARFYATLNFEFAPATFVLLKKMAASNELATLSFERILDECYKVFSASNEALVRFIKALIETESIEYVFPEMDVGGFLKIGKKLLDSNLDVHQKHALVLFFSKQPEFPLNKKVRNLLRNILDFHQMIPDFFNNDEELICNFCRKIRFDQQGLSSVLEIVSILQEKSFNSQKYFGLLKVLKAQDYQNLGPESVLLKQKSVIRDFLIPVK
jgi:tRNA nucleotidyltransferase/poly(A) polymerase